MPDPAPPAATRPIAKDQEDLNIEYYSKVFSKCLQASDKLVKEQLNAGHGTECREHVVAIATTLFDRFYNDQTSMKSGQLQAKAMIDGMTQVLEGRR